MNFQHRPATFDLDNRMTIVLFAGMGGGCDGLEQAGFHVHVAINHDPVAVAVHKKRHPHTRHLQCDVFEADPRAVCGTRGVRILHASPDCTHFSVAKGGKPVSKRRRSLAWVICRWAGTVRPEVITLENVVEIRTWGGLVAKRCKVTGRVVRLDGSVAARGERVPVEQQWLIPDPKKKGRIWRAWLKHMAGLGYNFEDRVLVCSDNGVHTIRKRLFGVGRADGGPIYWPNRTHAPRSKARNMKLKPWRGACEIIDWSLPVKSIFGRKKPLAEATLRRVALGVMRYVVNAANPFIVPITHSGSDRVHPVDEPLRTLTTAHRGELSVVVPSVTKFRSGAVGSDIRDPMPTVTANSFEKRPGGAIPLGLMSATLVQTGFGERNGQAPRAIDIEEPLGTQVAGGGKAALVAAFLAQHNNDSRRISGVNPGRPADEPLSTVTASGSQQGVIAASMLALRGTNRDGRDARDPVATLTANGLHAGVIAATMAEMRGRSPDGRDIEEPIAAQTGGNNSHLILAFLQHYFSNGKTSDDIGEPLGALTAKARHGLVIVTVGKEDYVITDIGIRMLEPEEGAAAHGFAPGALPTTITIDGRERRLTKTEKYHLVGNSVPPRMVQLLAECNARRELVMEAAE